MASIQYTAPKYGITNAKPWCGGALAFRSWVVTNAHCMTDMPAEVAAAVTNGQHFAAGATSIPMSDRQFSVRVGSHDRTQGGETATVTRIVVHPGWTWGATAPTDDIAMLKLDHPVNSQPIQLAPRAAQPGDRVQLFGWGADQPDGSSANLPTQLQQLATTVVDPARCADGGQTADEICTDNPNRTDGPGHGDSGGPAVKYVHGTAQLVGGCSRGTSSPYPGVAPTIYTSSPDFRSWIYDTARGVPAAA
ncbi:S1 family peptidase [Amycolatopsis mongoliensis]